jgi:hypothetical protein
MKIAYFHGEFSTGESLQGNHEASDGQKSDVGVSVPVIPS